MQAKLDAMTRSLAGSFAFVGMGVSHRGKTALATAAAPGIRADTQSIFRVASVSKTITGQMLDRKHIETDISPYLDRNGGFKLRHPDWPEVEITGGMLASHSAGLTDDGGYSLPPGTRMLDWIQQQGRNIWSKHRPGSHFSYCNLGYVILGTALHINQRFDQRAADGLTYMGVTGGFNWSGVSSQGRKNTLPTYRKDGLKFVAQIDENIAPAGVLDTAGQPIVEKHLQPGLNAGVFAPQGGLRTNLAGMLRIAACLKGTAWPVLWSPEMGTMDDEDGLFDQYSQGMQILRRPAFYSRPLIGHFGNAYGFNGGVWYDAQADLAFAYALNGVPMDNESDTLSEAERQVFDVIAGLP